MNPILRNTLAVIAGIIIGNIINFGIIMLSGSIVAPPEGVNPEDIESIKANMHLYSPRHFIMPFLAHAIGTLAGAFATVKLAASHHLKLALGIAVFFLLGGAYVVYLIPATPTWFAVLDILGAYLPMGWLGYKLGK